MKNTKNLKQKCITTITAFTVACSLAVNVQYANAAVIKDIGKSASYAREAIAALAEKNIINGGTKGYFNPTETVTRGHMVIMLVKALGYNTENVPSAPTFKDVPASHWAYKYVETAYREGIIAKGAQGVFGINEKCTREQMAAMFVRSLGLKDEQINNQQELLNVSRLKDKSKISAWAKDHVEFVMASGLMLGSGTTFTPGNPASREQAATVLYRYLNTRDKLSGMVTAITAPVQYPELYEALKKDILGYKGEMTSDILLKMRNTTLNEEISMKFNIDGAVNNMDSRLKSKMSITGAGMPDTQIDYDIISVKGKLYIKQAGDEKWSLVSLDDLSSINTPAAGMDSSKTAYEHFLRSYRKLGLNKIGNVDLNGVSANKYEITLNKEAYKNLLYSLASEGYFGQPDDIDELLNSQFEAKCELYLDGQNRIIKDYLNVTINLKDETTNENIEINIAVDTSYRNIGSDIIITAPSASEVYTDDDF